MLSILTIKLVITMKMIIHFFKIQKMTMINSLKFKKKKKNNGAIGVTSYRKFYILLMNTIEAEMTFSFSLSATIN